MESHDVKKVEFAGGARKRKGAGELHAVRDGILSRHLREALRRLDENPRRLRRMERDLRNALRPQGPLGVLLFDRFWSSFLRLVLISRLESKALEPRRTTFQSSRCLPSLQEGPVPTLVMSAEQQDPGSIPPVIGDFQPDVFQRLALVTRYDRAFAREMHRTLALLLVLRDHGDAGISGMLGAPRNPEEGRDG